MTSSAAYINRITVEFKSFRSASIEGRMRNINRITVEFKLCSPVFSECDIVYINRITVEFKCSIIHEIIYDRETILIESQWNLN